MKPKDARILQAVGMCAGLTGVFYLVALFGYGAWGTWYLGANLLLAAIPLMLTYPLLMSVKRHGWGGLVTWGWSAAWLLFLPNSFYLVTDVAHLFEHAYGMDPQFGVVVFGLFALTGMAMGLTSLYFVHRQVMWRVGRRRSHVLAGTVLLLSSVAIYLGHTLRWNTYDVVLHPVAVAQDIVSGTAGPTPQAVLLVVTFFVLTGGMYAAFWRVMGSNSR